MDGIHFHKLTPHSQHILGPQAGLPTQPSPHLPLAALPPQQVAPRLALLPPQRELGAFPDLQLPLITCLCLTTNLALNPNPAVDHLAIRSHPHH